QEVDRLVEQVHRAALALAEPVDATVQLRHRPARVGALGQAMAVLPIGRDRVVVWTHDGSRADRDGFLADVEVEEATDLPERVALRRLLLEPADQDHVVVQTTGEPRVDLGRLCNLLLSHGLLGHEPPPCAPQLQLAYQYASAPGVV